MRAPVKVLGAALALALWAAAPAQAEFGLKEFSAGFFNEDGSPARQAGSHPFEVSTSFNVNTKPGFAEEVPDGDAKELRFQLPPGLVGSTTAVPRCATADFLTVAEDGYPACPDASAVGTTQAQILHLGRNLSEPVYNLVPPPGVAAKLGFIAFNIPTTIEIGLSQEPPTNVIAGVLNVPQVVEFYGAGLQVWGVPADHRHDPFRGRCLALVNVDHYGEVVSRGTCEAGAEDTGAEEAPFLTMPRSCSGPLAFSYEATSWQQPDALPDTGSVEAPGMTGCSRLGFSPQATASPTASSAESASGLDFGIDISDEGLTSATGLAQSNLKKAVVRMPAGMTLNPSAANGLLACPRAGYERESLGTAPGEGCPQASKVGEVEVESPLLEEGEAIHGSVFLAGQDDNPFGSLIALYMVIKSPKLGILVKQAGKVEPSEGQGPEAGRIVTTFDGIPEVPFSHFRFHFKEGARGPLITPPACGAYAVDAELTPSGAPSSPLDKLAPFDITSGVGNGPCPPGGVAPFHPGFSAGSINNAAGAYSPFGLRLTRSDGEQAMTRFDAVIPKGVTAKLAGVARCPASAIALAKAKSGRQELAAPSCPANSQIGRSLAGAGVGSVLTYAPGKLYLGGPVGTAPLSVIAITPALAGPFDIGTVVLREALSVDPETAEVRVDGALSDPIPTALRGIILKVKDVRAHVDRPDFTLNPTSCARKEAKATLFGSFLDAFNPADDVPVALSDRYQAASCAGLKFKPRLSLKLKGATRRGAHPALRGTVSYPEGSRYANTRKAVITFPHSAFLEQSHIRTICTRVQFKAGQCPPGSIYGKARAFTPLLDEPLEGPVYLRSSSHPLPDLVLALHGLIDFNAVARIDSVNASIRASFDSVPDAPLRKVVVQMRGGKKGLILNSRDLCAHKSRAKARFTAQNGKAYQQRPVLKADCGSKKK
jgi:hypothetical protein